MLFFLTEPFNFVQQKVNVLLPGRWKTGQRHSKEVSFVLARQRRVSNHNTTSPDHSLFDSGGHRVQFRPPIVVLLQSSNTLRNIPETHVRELKLTGLDGTKTVALGDDLFQIFCHGHGIVHQTLEFVQPASFKHEPKLENVHFSAALNAFITRIV